MSGTLTAGAAPPRRPSLLGRYARAFFTSPSGRAAAVAVLLLALVAVVAPIVLDQAATRGNVLQAGQGPSPAHPFGTDRLGRDILARTLVATRLSLGLALAAAALAALIGFPLGAVVSILGPRARSAAMRGIDVLLSFPPLLLAIFVAAIAGTGAEAAVFAIGVAFAPNFARLAATLAASVAGREYVAGARIVGLSRGRLVARYILPNIAETLAISTFVSVGSSLVAISSLSFLGLGVQPPQFDWGRMLTEGVQAFYVTPSAALAPAGMVALTGLTVGFLGEALARAANPLLWVRSDPAGRPTLAVAPAPAAASGASSAAVQAPASGTTAPSPPAGEPLLAVRGLTVRFPGPGGGVTVVDGLSFELARGEIVGIVGESGSGKSMTALAIAGLVPYPGQIGADTLALEGADLLKLTGAARDRLLGTRLAMVFQDPMSSLNPALRVGRQLTEGAEVHRRLPHREALRVAADRLRDVHVSIPEVRLGQYPHELSGGMRQRAMIAMGLMNEPALILADEPTTALDVTVQAQVIDVLREANEVHGTAVVLISHNIGVVAELCSRVLVMYAGRIVEDVSIATLLAGPAHPYTRALIAAVPGLTADRDQPLATIPGRPPDLAALPAGCAFAPRCACAVDRCHREPPPLMPLAGGQRAACWVAGGIEGAPPQVLESRA